MSKMKNGQRKTEKNLPFAPKCCENFVGQKLFVTDFFGHAALDKDNKMITKSTFCRFDNLLFFYITIYNI